MKERIAILRLANFPVADQAGLRMRLLHWALVVALSLLMVAALSVARFPAAMLIGPLIVATGFGLRGTPIRMPRRLHEAAQGVAGCLIAHHLTPEIVQSVVELWPVVLLFVVLTLLAAMLVGVVVGRLTSVGGEEAVWGFLPGMAGAMIAMSHERGLDSRLVAFMQLLRLLMVIFVMSLVSRALAGDVLHGAAVPQAAPGAMQTGVMLTLAVVMLGPLAARFMRFLPAGASLVPLMVAGLLQSSGWVDMALPAWLLIGAYMVLGVQVGLRFTPALVRHALGILVPVLIAALVLMLLCAASGVVLSLIVGVDILTGMLATVPGSIETIAIIAINSNADVSFVMTMQVIRLFAVVLIGPPLARGICRIAFHKSGTGTAQDGIRTPGE